MTVSDRHQRQAIDRNFSSVVDFLERKFRKNHIHLREVPSYFYQGNESKLEVTVYSHPNIARIDVRKIDLKNYDREPAFESSYDLNSLSITTFEREIDDLISKIK
ncbi:MAG: hypothetical protein Tsb0014_40720 [Pleurocapsa sp.]